MASEASFQSYPSRPNSAPQRPSGPDFARDQPHGSPFNQPEVCNIHFDACTTRDKCTGRPRVCGCTHAKLIKKDKKERAAYLNQSSDSTMGYGPHPEQYGPHRNYSFSQRSDSSLPARRFAYPENSETRSETSYESGRYSDRRGYRYSQESIAEEPPHACTRKIVECSPSCETHQGHACTAETASCDPSCFSHRRSSSNIGFQGPRHEF